MSNVWARMLIAGTVNPETSPRPRARYSSWMLADRAPSAWLASQTIQRAASAVGSSFVNAAVQARSAAAWLRKRASSSMTSRPSATWATPVRLARRSAGDSATYGMRLALLWVSLAMVAATRVRRVPPSPAPEAA